jgi:hypothetical protein
VRRLLRGSAECGQLGCGVVEDRGCHDRPRIAARLVLSIVGSVEQVTVVDECGGAATVEVDRLAGAEVGDHLGELDERESCVNAGPSAVTDERDQLVIGGTECGSGWRPEVMSESIPSAECDGGRSPGSGWSR